MRMRSRAGAGRGSVEDLSVAAVARTARPGQFAAPDRRDNREARQDGVDRRRAIAGHLHPPHPVRVLAGVFPLFLGLLMARWISREEVTAWRRSTWTCAKLILPLLRGRPGQPALASSALPCFNRSSWTDRVQPPAERQPTQLGYAISRIRSSISGCSRSSSSSREGSVSPKWYGYRMRGFMATATSATISGVIV